MKSTINPTLIAEMIRDSGIIAVEMPTVYHPIAVNLFYRSNPDGSIRYIWPKGNLRTDLSTVFSDVSGKNKWLARFHRMIFTLGFAGAVFHGKLVLYTDVPTATYLQSHWQMNVQIASIN